MASAFLSGHLKCFNTARSSACKDRIYVKCERKNIRRRRRKIKKGKSHCYCQCAILLLNQNTTVNVLHKSCLYLFIKEKMSHLQKCYLSTMHRKSTSLEETNDHHRMLLNIVITRIIVITRF